MSAKEVISLIMMYRIIEIILNGLVKIIFSKWLGGDVDE